MLKNRLLSHAPTTGSGGYAYADGWNLNVGVEECGRGGIVQTDSITLPTSIATGATFVVGFSGDDFWKLTHAIACGLWLRAAGASADLATFRNSAADFVLTLRKNGCTVPGAENIPVEEIIPTLTDERQKLRLGFKTATDNYTVEIRYIGTGYSANGQVTVRAIILSSTLGCAPSREVLEILGAGCHVQANQDAPSCGCSVKR